MKKLPKLKNTKKYTWLIAYINTEFIKRVKRDLKKSIEYNDVQAFIPTVRILKKVHKGKNSFEEIPLLFNYGFFRVPRVYAISPEYLDNMRINISCIISWLKDPMKVQDRTKKKKKKKNPDEDAPEDLIVSKYNRQRKQDAKISVGTATSAELERLITDTFSYSAHSAKDLEKLKPGTFIILRGYPWEGVPAELVEVDMKKLSARVIIFMMNKKMEVKVAFDNVFFTIYHAKGFDDKLSTLASLDEMADRNVLDKLTFMRDGKVDRV